MKILWNEFYRLARKQEFDWSIKLYFTIVEVVYCVNITIDGICCFNVWIKNYEPRYVKVYRSDIEEQLIDTKAMDHDVYTARARVRRLNQLHSHKYTWTDFRKHFL